MRLGITARPDVREPPDLAARVARFAEERGAVAIMDTDIVETTGWAGAQAPLSEMEIDVLVTIGGDGTILRALQHIDRPLLSINMGALGFLTEVTPEMWREGITRLLEGEYSIDARSKIETWVDDERQPDAVNEAVIHTTQISKMRHFYVVIDEHPALDFRADGLIVATPTGSTCYAMSVGAPIVDPKAPVMIIVPIAPFNLSARPLVISAESEVEVTLLDGKDALLVLDGQIKREIAPDVDLRFVRSPNEARFIRFDTDFYSRFRRKLARLMASEAGP